MHPVPFSLHPGVKFLQPKSPSTTAYGIRGTNNGRVTT